jgi:hypothetical protein
MLSALPTQTWIRRSRTAVIGTLAACLVSVATAATPVVKLPQVDSPQRVLLVGNSYLYYGDSLHNHLRRIAAAAEPAWSKTLQYKSATIGGASLKDHNIDWLTKPGQIGIKEPFQLVILQGHSAAALSDKRQEAFRQAATEANKLITARGGKTALYMTHAYVAPHKEAKPDSIRQIESFYIKMGNELNALVIPVGLAFEEAYRRHPELKLHKAYDGSHPSLIGTYLAAATAFGAIYGKPTVGNAFDAFGEIDPVTLKKLQQVADDTVKKFFGR